MNNEIQFLLIIVTNVLYEYIYNRGNWVWVYGNFLYYLYDFSVILKTILKLKEVIFKIFNSRRQYDLLKWFLIRDVSVPGWNFVNLAGRLLLSQ